MSGSQSMELEALHEYLETEISPTELGQVLEAQLRNLIRLSAKSGEPITQEQAEGMQQVAQLRDLLRQQGQE